MKLKMKWKKNVCTPELYPLTCFFYPWLGWWACFYKVSLVPWVERSALFVGSKLKCKRHLFKHTALDRKLTCAHSFGWRVLTGLTHIFGPRQKSRQEADPNSSLAKSTSSLPLPNLQIRKTSTINIQLQRTCLKRWQGGPQQRHFENTQQIQNIVPIRTCIYCTTLWCIAFVLHEAWSTVNNLFLVWYVAFLIFFLTLPF